MFDALFNQNSPARQFPDGATNITRITIIIGRSWNLLFDWLLVNWLAPWPVRFFFEGPLTWRREVGILTTEVVVRRDRGWPTVVDSEKWYEEESNFAIDNVIMPAIAADRLGKTGSLLVDSNWNVEYQAMIEAHNLIRNRKAHFEDFKTACLVNHAGASRVWDKLRKKGKGRARNETTDPSPGDDEAWLIWRVDPFDEEEDYKDPSQREKIDQIEGALKEMGKEDLFFRWVELMQYEMSSPGGWTVEKQQVCERKTKELFESENVDFEEFWKKIGGMEGVSK
ncbi:hypothetical protein KEM55_000622 [Ascosphaera atra]|nr:hypothetical protein KEM55_000622 [Ascosphaera atra]